jgi:hypothetical protein
MASLTDTQIQLINIISNALFQKPLKIQETIDWTTLYNEAYSQAVLPLVYSTIGQLIPEEYSHKWRSKSDQILAQNINVSFEHSMLNELMIGNNIPYVILKGVASSAYYQNPILRTFGDVDFLIRKDDIERTGKLLEQEGFTERKDKSNFHHKEYYRETLDGAISTRWEVHYCINGIPTSDIGDIIEEYMEDIFDTSVDFDEGNGFVRIPDNFHHGLILLLHTANHMTKEGVGLRHLCDWVAFTEHFSSKEFTDMFEERLKTIGLWKFAQLLTICGIRYLGCTPKTWIGSTDEKTAELMFGDIINGGNFGSKDIDRYQQKKYIYNSCTRTIDDNSILNQVYIAFNNKTKRECPIINKFPLLKPLAYMRTAVVFMIEIINGKRRLGNKETVQKATLRKEIYKQFNLFKPEV